MRCGYCPHGFSLSAAHSKGHNGILDVHAVLGLVIDDRLRTIDHGVAYFNTPVGRKAVHVDGILFGEGHTPLITNPALVASNGLNHSGFVWHSYQGTPTLGVDDVRTYKGFIHVMDYFETAASLLCIGARVVKDLWHQFKL